MPHTPTHQIPYPTPSDPALVPKDLEAAVRVIDAHLSTMGQKLTQRDELQVTTTGTGVWTVQDGLGNPLTVNTDGTGRWTIGA